MVRERRASKWDSNQGIKEKGLIKSIKRKKILKIGGSMAEDFNTDSMLSMFLYESSQLLEKLEGIILENRMQIVLMMPISMKFSVSCILSKAHPGY